MKPQRIAPQTYTIYGLNGALEVLNAQDYSINYIDIKSRSAAEKDQKINSLIKNYKSKVKILNADKFSIKYTQLRTQGIVVTFKWEVIKHIPLFKKTKTNICLLAMDNVEDPQNLGQIIRTAECAGLDGLILPERGGTQLTDAALQVSQGAFVTLPIYSCGNVQQTLQQLKDDGFWIVGVENDEQAKVWYEVDYSGKVAIVVGSEGQGIRQLVRRRCDFLATIPMQGQINSLNVSAAVSVVLFERQRQINA